MGGNFKIVNSSKVMKKDKILKLMGISKGSRHFIYDLFSPKYWNVIVSLMEHWFVKCGGNPGFRREVFLSHADHPSLKGFAWNTLTAKFSEEDSHLVRKMVMFCGFGAEGISLTDRCWWQSVENVRSTYVLITGRFPRFGIRSMGSWSGGLYNTYHNMNKLIWYDMIDS